MKSYVLIGGGLLICLVLLHALVSAWRANRRVPHADGVDAEPDALDMEAEDSAEILWSEDAQAELVGDPVVEESAADEEPGPPVLMEPTTASVETTAGTTGTESPSLAAAESSPDETPVVESTDAPPLADEDPEGLRRGRRIEIAGKRTEPTVPRAMRPEFLEFTPLAPSAGEREGLAPRWGEPEEPRHESNVPESLDEIIVVWVFARPGRQLDGETLLKTFVTHGLKCDADRVFKKTDPRCGGPWYSVANGVEPGTFDISRPAALETPGVVLLLNLGEVRDPGPAFEDMLDVAQDLAIALDAELKDEGMSDMSAQTIEHCRQRIRDHRRLLLRA
ncbi:MAG: hypothetical protein OXH68_11660 [Gammaproteobacteria bacterium]|nr:hypothetical protein [Gammaproteobacteria bacterium]